MAWVPMSGHVAAGTTGVAGVKVGCRLRRDGRKALAVSVNARALAQFFDGSLADGASVAMGTGPDAGRLRIAKPAPGAKGTVRAGGLPRGGALLLVAARGAQFGEARPAETCPIAWDGQGLVVTLPDWARDEAGRARMETEFGLAPVPRASDAR